MGLFSGLTDFLKTTVQTVGSTTVSLANSSVGNVVANALIKKQLGVDTASSPVMNGSVNPNTTPPQSGGTNSGQEPDKEGDGIKTPIMSNWKRFLNAYKIDDQGFFELKEGKKQLSFFKIGCWIVIPIIVSGIIYFVFIRRRKKSFKKFKRYGSR